MNSEHLRKQKQLRLYVKISSYFSVKINVSCKERYMFKCPYNINPLSNWGKTLTQEKCLIIQHVNYIHTS